MFSRLSEPCILAAQRWRIAHQFRQSMGYDGDFENPRTHQEKMQFRKLYGNHAFYALAADKYRIREYVQRTIGAQYLIPLLGVYKRLKRSDFDELPSQFIIKANHGCKWNQVVTDKANLDFGATVRRFNRLMFRRYGWIAGERHYNFIPPRIVIEPLLQADAGGLPWDYSFFCYHGPAGFAWTHAVCSPSGRAVSFGLRGEILANTLTDEELAAHAQPANLAQMAELAEALSVEFDFVRVDLYAVQDRIYFGELTCTPHQGYGQMACEAQQRLRNEMWRLDADNPRLYRRPAPGSRSPGRAWHAVPLAGRARSTL